MNTSLATDIFHTHPDSSRDATGPFSIPGNLLPIVAALQAYFLPADTGISGCRELKFNENAGLFFDVDGTLSAIAPRPGDAFIPQESLRCLQALQQGGVPVALITGRSLASLDALTSPYIFTAAGQHGLELRLPGGEVMCAGSGECAFFARLEQEITSFGNKHNGLIIENKSMGIAVHYRQAPHLAHAVQEKLEAIARQYQDTLMLQQGKMVSELRLKGSDKGAAILRLLGYAPFMGKLPVFFGDDITDEDGFAAVNRVDGISIKIGEGATRAQYRAANPIQLQEWLQSITTSISGENHG